MHFSKPVALAFSLFILAAVALPVHENWEATPKDDFPLSYYPMFSRKRDSLYTLHYVVGYDSLGSRMTIPYKLMGSGGFNQVRRQLNKSCSEGESKQFAEKVARRIAKQEVHPYNTVTRIEVVKGSYHLENFFLNKAIAPAKEKVLVEESVNRNLPKP